MSLVRPPVQEARGALLAAYLTLFVFQKFSSDTAGPRKSIYWLDGHSSRHLYLVQFVQSIKAGAPRRTETTI
ncbi:hypothetical protein OBBRIDRAFT_109918 [Obba rivulosa]|uniref:Uncharacterized protein n=1 Tax=Obba rivulosa TaxID=1052685 RepID=A0A8E2DML0_9APHY|nr:hypothetical protein OBBRIDRAFT_109918 [Obba rivulosa]